MAHLTTHLMRRVKEVSWNRRRRNGNGHPIEMIPEITYALKIVTGAADLS